MIEAIELTSTRRSRGPGAGPVADVSFDVYPGQVTALLGAPGAGKSTVLRMMVELEPAGGRTLFGGRLFHALRPAVREVGLALNPDALHPGRTVQAHLQLYAAAGGVPKGRIAEVLEIAGLSTQATVRCGRLDPGRRERLAIAAALLGDPSALILDEPHALDSQGMSWFHALIRAYAAQGRTVLVAATDPDSLAGTADHVVVLRRGDEDGISRVIASRSAAEVFDERRATVIQVRSPQAARLAAVLETEGGRLSAAGPGALQVRGLDRARIGEVAHVAGICLHELSEIGQDGDVFGLRPPPRHKGLLPGLNQVDGQNTGIGATWHSGVRVISAENPTREIAKAEVAGPAAESGLSGVSDASGASSAEAPMHAPVAEWRGSTSAPGQADESDQGAKAPVSSLPGVVPEAGPTMAHQPQSATEASHAHADRSQDAAEAGQPSIPQTHPGAEAQSQVAAQAGQTRGDWARVAVVANESQAPGADAQSQVAAQAAQTHGDWARVAAVANESQAPGADAQSQVAAQAGQTRDHQARVAVATNESQAPPAEAGRSPEGKAITPGLQAIAPIPRVPSKSPAPKRTVNRAFATFRRRGKGEAPEVQPQVIVEATSSPSPVQPAVPFTVSASPTADSGPDAEGMTPWRAVAARAGRGQQGSVVEAASAEQEASA